MPPPSTSGPNPNSQDHMHAPRELRLLITPFSPSSPSSSTSPPQPPPSPCPWLWRCHSCFTIYRLAVTRRCLDCAHTFCLGDAAGGGTANNKKSRRRSGPCKAEFDYTGWKARGAWRRTVLLNKNSDSSPDPSQDQTTTGNRDVPKKGGWGDEHKAATYTGDVLDYEAANKNNTMQSFDARREHLFLRRRHDCSLHCDFPSQCHHALFRAQQDGRPILREALALDAAREALELEGGGDGGGRDGKKEEEEEEEEVRTVSRHGPRARARLYPSSHSSDGDYDDDALRFIASLLPVVEEEAIDIDIEETVSPCSPTSPDPPGDLMREVVQHHHHHHHQQQQVPPVELEAEPFPPVSPTSPEPAQPRRRSLLAATETPADFATTAAELCFDEDDEVLEFGPFVFDTTSPSRATINNDDLLLLQAAYSEQPWFPTTTDPNPFTPSSKGVTTTTILADPPPPLPPKSPERVGRRDRMLALLGRRGAVGGGGEGRCAAPPPPASSSPPTSKREVDIVIEHAPSLPHQHPSTTGWDAWSWPLPSSSPTPTDADGDVTMRDASPPPPPSPADTEDEDEDEDVSPATRPRRQRSGGDGTDEDLRALLRMRNAFMRGEMV